MDNLEQTLRLNSRQDNGYYNCGSQQAGLVKYGLHKINTIGIWSNYIRRYKTRTTQYTVHSIKCKIKHANSFAVLKVGQDVVEELLTSFGS